MTPDQHEKLEQVAREWLHSIGFSHNALDLFKHHEGLATLLSAQRVVVLEEVAEHLKAEAKRYRNDATDFVADDEAVLSYGLTVRTLEAIEEWCRQQAQEQRL